MMSQETYELAHSHSQSNFYCQVVIAFVRPESGSFSAITLNTSLASSRPYSFPPNDFGLFIRERIAALLLSSMHCQQDA
jgi:hypothetical protein